jgi:hypothetical protein
MGGEFSCMDWSEWFLAPYPLLMAPAMLQGKVGHAPSFLIRGEVLPEAPLPRLQGEPFYFVDRQ